MPGPDTLNEFVSAAGEKQLNDVIAKLERANTLIIEFNQVGRSAERQNGQAQTMRQLTAATQELERVTRLITSAESENAKNLAAAKVQYSELQRQLRENAQAENTLFQARKAQSEAAKQRIAEEKELDRLIKEEEKTNVAAKRKEEAQARRDQAAAEKEYAKWWEESLREQERAAASTPEAIAAKARLKEETRQLNQQLRAEAQAELATEGSLDALSAQLVLARSEYDAFSATVRDSDVGKAALANIQALDAEVKRIESSTGRDQRKVGSYTSSIDASNLRRELQGLFREVPSVRDLNQLFLSWSNQLPQAGEALGKVADRAKELKEEVIAATAAQEAAAQVQGQTSEVAKQVEESFSDQVDSVVDQIAASKEQAVAIKEQIAAQIESAEAGHASTAEVSANTEALLVNAGATGEDAAAVAANAVATVESSVANIQATTTLEAETVALEEATAARAAYGSVIGNVFKTLFSGQTALLLGIFLLTSYGSKAAAAIKTVFAGNESNTLATRRAAEAQKQFDDSVGKTDKTIKKYVETLNSIEETERNAAYQDIARLNVLTTVAADNAQSTKNRERAIKELQETYPDYFGNLDKEAILQGKTTDAINDATKALLARAAAQAAEKKFSAASETIYDLEGQLKDANDVLKKAQDAYKNGLNGYIPNATAVAASYQRDIRKAQGSVDDLTGALTDARKEQLGYLEDARRFSLDAGQTLFKKDPKTPKTKTKTFDSTNEEINSEERINKAIAQLQIQRIQQDSETQKAIFDNEQESLANRLTAAQQYYSNELEQQSISEAQELANIDVNLDKIRELEKKSAAARTKEEKALVLQKEAFEAERLTVSEKYGALEATATRESAERQRAIVTKVIQDQLTERQKLYDNQISSLKLNLTRLEQVEREALAQRYATGQIKEEAYQNKLQEINARYDVEELERTQSVLMQQLQYLEQYGDDSVATREKIADAEKKLSDITKGIEKEKADYAIKQNERVAANRKKIRDKTLELAQELAQLLQTIASANTERQLRYIDLQEAAVEKQKTAEVDAINASTLSQEEKQRRVAEAEARATAQSEQLAERRKQLQRRQAEFERGITIAQIIAKTAEAVVSQLAVVGAGVALAAIAAGIGAVQLATVLATPLPQYAEGTAFHPGGPAIMGEQGAELVKERDGRMWLTANKATLYGNLTRGAEVIPHEEVLRMASVSAMYDLRNVVAPAGGDGRQYAELRGEIREQTKVISRAIEKIPGAQINYHGGFGAYITKSTR